MPCQVKPPQVKGLALGIDLGTSGLRLALVESPETNDPLWEAASPYPGPFDNPASWHRGLTQLVWQIPVALRARVGALCVDGTSGTLLLCQTDGTLINSDHPCELSKALAYHQACPEQSSNASALATCGPGPASAQAAGASGSLARALRLLGLAQDAGRATGMNSGLLLRHQADWIMGGLLGHWRYGEAGNNLRLGWVLGDPVAGIEPGWAGAIATQPWSEALPTIVSSGTVLGPLAPRAAALLGLPPSCQVVAGSTDANAAVLAASPAATDGVAVLGTTLVLKQWVERPITAAGITCHRVAGRWLLGGASNAGAGILRQFFSDAQIVELSRQIDPRRPTGLNLRPLASQGERFPIDDPELMPVLGPRPVSDARYLQSLLEGLTAIEAAGWRRLQALGAPPVQRVISVGGGAHNPQWRALRQRALGIPVLNRPQLSAALGMARLAATCLPPR